MRSGSGYVSMRQTIWYELLTFKYEPLASNMICKDVLKKENFGE
jgi:hypothetical protein